jgi:hypothetical protein
MRIKYVVESRTNLQLERIPSDRPSQIARECRTERGFCGSQEVREPATTHYVTVAQLRRWVDGVAVSPDETLKKRKLREFLA